MKMADFYSLQKNVLQGFLNESKKADILVYKKLTIFGLQKIDM